MAPIVAIAAAFCILASILPGHSQPAPSHAHIGLLTSNTPEASVPFREALLQGLRELGYVEGKNLSLSTEYAPTIRAAAPLARELADSGIAVLVATGAATPDALKVVREIPVVYIFSGDPVAAGWATSLATPNEGATGMTWLSIELNGKRIELLKEAFPSIRRLAILANPLHPGEDMEIAESRKAAETFGISLLYLQSPRHRRVGRRLAAAGDGGRRGRDHRASGHADHGGARAHHRVRRRARHAGDLRLGAVRP